MSQTSESDPAPRTPRARARERTEHEILRIARGHLATDGAAGLSLRAIARDLGVVSSAVYRYVRSRDDLLTLLVVDGYRELGEAVDSAVDAVDPADHRGRLFALGRAVRAWASLEPATYALLYGTPVPGYRAPGEQTTGPGTRVIRTLAAMIERAWVDGALLEVDGDDDHGGPDPQSPLAKDLQRVRDEMGLTVPDALVARTALVWVSIFGCVTFEVFGQYGVDTFTDPAALFDHHLSTLAETLGFPDPARS